MKKTIIFATFAAFISLVSCQKKEVIDNGTDKTVSPIFTAVIETGTKTTVDAISGKVSWESTDKITVKDASTGSAVYKIANIDDTGKATFEKESGELGEGPYTATYGTAPSTEQTYSATAGNLYMTAPETENNSFSFTVQCGLLEINLTKTGESVKSITVIGTPTGESETIYTLTCTTAQSIAAKKAFYIAVPAGSYNKIVIKNSEDRFCPLTAASGITVASNHIKPLTFEGSKLDFLPSGALPGVFSVSADKQIHFSKGNLYYDGSKFDFEAIQYEFHTYDSNNWGLFGWVGASSLQFTSSPEIYGVSISDADKADYGNVPGETLKADWGKAIDNNDTWRTLSASEWQYLIKEADDLNIIRQGKYKYGVEVCGKTNCLVLAPDDWNLTTNPLQESYDSSAWAIAEKKGLVCLPAAGCRVGSDVYNVGDNGGYWSSSTCGEATADRVSFNSNSVDPQDPDNRSVGYSVRLITES